MQNHPVTMMRIDNLPVSVYEDGSVEIMDEHSGVPVTLSREQLEKIVAVSRQPHDRRRAA
jgi:malate/lactate dehydrogenase